MCKPPILQAWYTPIPSETQAFELSTVPLLFSPEVKGIHDFLKEFQIAIRLPTGLFHFFSAHLKWALAQRRWKLFMFPHFFCVIDLWPVFVDAYCIADCSHWQWRQEVVLNLCIDFHDRIIRVFNALGSNVKFRSVTCAQRFLQIFRLFIDSHSDRKIIHPNTQVLNTMILFQWEPYFQVTPSHPCSMCNVICETHYGLMRCITDSTYKKLMINITNRYIWEVELWKSPKTYI